MAAIYAKFGQHQAATPRPGELLTASPAARTSSKPQHYLELSDAQVESLFSAATTEGGLEGATRSGAACSVVPVTHPLFHGGEQAVALRRPLAAASIPAPSDAEFRSEVELMNELHGLDGYLQLHAVHWGTQTQVLQWHPLGNAAERLQRGNWSKMKRANFVEKLLKAVQQLAACLDDGRVIAHGDLQVSNSVRLMPSGLHPYASGLHPYGASFGYW